ncbi:hypothetical protein K431DRAFT_330012 [Polychaeton citri CBS 116435]|uniref:Uncharacterized protein n=1 Tax=Polychaeton citri CBS 116435 TaxID=1314669 RepID=A0A9P4Q8Z4_9PEZI|nr:hypothetical protein K431DRAFT_330012 [Polychaeton citri CBS 116435]
MDGQPTFFRYINGQAISISEPARKPITRKVVPLSSESMPSSHAKPQAATPITVQKPVLPSFDDFLKQAPIKAIGSPTAGIFRTFPDAPMAESKSAEQAGSPVRSSASRSTASPVEATPSRPAIPASAPSPGGNDTVVHKSIGSVRSGGLDRTTSLGMVDLAKHYTIAEIMHNANVWQKAHNSRELTSKNVLNRLRRAVEHVAKASGRTPASVRNGIDEAKKANGTYGCQIGSAKQASLKARTTNKDTYVI